VDAGEDREYSRQPRPEDLTKICAALNREGARYILIGGLPVIAETQSVAHGSYFSSRSNNFRILLYSSAQLVGSTKEWSSRG